jgi:hypothetical protein
MIKHIAKMKKNYYAPTPKKWRKIGDALLGVSLMGIPAELAGYKGVAITIFIFGVIGKFLTNLFAEDVKDNQNGN